MTQPPVLHVSGLQRRFQRGGAAAVEDVGFTMAQGELLALLGASGCGKTTTLRMIGGFETPDTGSITMHGAAINHLPPEKRGIGFVFQDYALFPHLNVLENVCFGLTALPRQKAHERGRAMLAMVGLEAMAQRRPQQLSGGQQQRVALARTLAPAPSLILLDEPFSNLDAALRVETRQEVRQLLKNTGAAAILVTHDQEDALALADRIAVMNAGKIVQIDTPEKLYTEPGTAFVATFLGRATIIEGIANGREAATPIGTVPLLQPASGAVTLAIRPEQMQLYPAINGCAVITAREFRGHDQLYRVECGGIRLMVIADYTAQLVVGSRVDVKITAGVVLQG